MITSSSNLLRLLFGFTRRETSLIAIAPLFLFNVELITLPRISLASPIRFSLRTSIDAGASLLLLNAADGSVLV